MNHKEYNKLWMRKWRASQYVSIESCAWCRRPMEEHEETPCEHYALVKDIQILQRLNFNSLKIARMINAPLGKVNRYWRKENHVIIIRKKGEVPGAGSSPKASSVGSTPTSPASPHILNK